MRSHRIYWLLVVCCVYLFLYLKGEDIDIDELLNDQIVKAKNVDENENPSMLEIKPDVVNPFGWFTRTAYSVGNCAPRSVFVTLGIVINECLYSPKYNIYFQALCGTSKSLSLFS